ncbi:MAG TPA: aminodeoxychorismate lyase [Steroidobacteraceae bacterium]|nr:aminodeoxychorismate lyase [Steroidobacteraceae bacterium]
MSTIATWINGRPAAEVSALERGLHYGDGLFETIACSQGRARLLDRHLQRLAAGCARLAIAPIDPAVIAHEVREVARGADRAIVKVLLTRGPATARGYVVAGEQTPTRITLRYRWPEDDVALGDRGVRVRIADVRLGENPALAGLKHCNRLEQVLARREWNDPQISEALMFSSSGALISGTTSNVFLVQDGVLLTPRVDRCGVAGVMRAEVLAAAAACGVRAEERVLDARDLARTQELFLTNALIGVRPVYEVAGRPLPQGAVTRQLQAQLAVRLIAAAGRDGEVHA